MVPKCIEVRLVESRELAILRESRAPETVGEGIRKRARMLRAIAPDLVEGQGEKWLEGLPLAFVEHRQNHLAAPAVELCGH